MVKSAYRIDAASIVLNPEENLEAELNFLGFKTRVPNHKDILRTAKGYDKSRARIIDVGTGEYTLQMREEWQKLEDGRSVRKPDSGFIALSGNDLEKVPLRQFLQSTNYMAKGTRFDVACDLIYKDVSMLENTQNKLSYLVGFSPDYKNGNVQNPRNSITSGRLNTNSPIRTASKTVSNGMTLYIGGRQSKYMARCYNKTAEVLTKTGNTIPPTLRVEHEVKQENADAVRKFIVSSKGTQSSTSKMLWHNLANDFITFKGETFGNVLGLGTAREIKLDYSKIEGNTMTYEFWVKSAVAPKFDKLYKDMSLEERVQQALRLMLSDADYEEYMKNK